MGWLDYLLGESPYSKTIKKIRARENSELQREATATIGKMTTIEERKNKIIDALEDAHVKELEELRAAKEIKEKESLDLLWVIDGAKLQCNVCTNTEGVLKVNTDTPSTQDKKTATILENDARSLLFSGNCLKSPNSAVPCLIVMELGDWQNTGTVLVQDQPPLLQKSTIRCLYGGVDIKITDSGQVNEPEINPLF